MAKVKNRSISAAIAHMAGEVAYLEDQFSAEILVLEEEVTRLSNLCAAQKAAIQRLNG